MEWRIRALVASRQGAHCSDAPVGGRSSIGTTFLVPCGAVFCSFGRSSHTRPRESRVSSIVLEHRAQRCLGNPEASLTGYLDLPLCLSSTSDFYRSPNSFTIKKLLIRICHHPRNHHRRHHPMPRHCREEEEKQPSLSQAEKRSISFAFSVPLRMR